MDVTRFEWTLEDNVRPGDWLPVPASPFDLTGKPPLEVEGCRWRCEGCFHDRSRLGGEVFARNIGRQSRNTNRTRNERRTDSRRCQSSKRPETGLLDAGFDIKARVF